MAILDRDAAAGSALMQRIEASGSRARHFDIDLTDGAACLAVVDRVRQALGPIAVLVNNAGVNDSVVLGAEPDAFRASLEKNLVHVYAMARACRSDLIETRGAIVNVGSKVVSTGQGSTSGYAAAKGAVHALTREWAVALASHGVRVNAVVPAEVYTPMYAAWLESRPKSENTRQRIERLIPLGRRMTTPEEIAQTIVFLASGLSSHTTGQIVYVDGGYTHLDRACTQD